MIITDFDGDDDDDDEDDKRDYHYDSWRYSAQIASRDLRDVIKRTAYQEEGKL